MSLQTFNITTASAVSQPHVLRRAPIPKSRPCGPSHFAVQRNKLKILLLASVGAVVFTSGLAHADTIYVSGAMCARIQATSLDLIEHTPQGTLNIDQTTLSTPVTCPLPSWSSSASDGRANAQVTIEAATLVYTEGLLNTPFSCWLNVEDWAGGQPVTIEPTLYSSSTYGGLPYMDHHPTPVAGQLNWSWSPPLAPLYPTQIAIVCTMPPQGAIIRGYNFTISVIP